MIETIVAFTATAIIFMVAWSVARLAARTGVVKEKHYKLFYILFLLSSLIAPLLILLLIILIVD